MPSGQRLIMLSEIIKAIPGSEISEADDRIITGIVFDSRQLKPGNLFVALTGASVDGHRFIPEALDRGAAAIVGMNSLHGLAKPYFQVNDTRVALANLAAAFYGYPARQLIVIGVTGTDGKTTTSNLIYHILRTAGVRVGMITTVNAVIGERILDTGFHVTTPEAPDVQKYLAEMVSTGLEMVILEATSHGLDQHRLGGCDFDIGVVTNITHEHLDYHGSHEAYRAAKARLFSSLSETPPKKGHFQKGAVLNRDDDSFVFLADLSKVRHVTYGVNHLADVQALHIEYQPSKTHFEVLTRQITGEILSIPIDSALVGEFNVSNSLAAIATCVNLLYLPIESVQQALLTFPGVPGRMERITIYPEAENIQGFAAIVDFAHTPNALKKSLEAVRSMTDGKVIAVFGSAGLRDRAKRRLMAEVAVKYADYSIFTAEDPRSEDLNLILAEMATGAIASGGIEGENFWRVPDRGEAIRFAIRLAKSNDLVIACGKGHEQSMCFGTIEYPWDDRIAMRAALAEFYRLPGPKMPKLPTSIE